MTLEERLTSYSQKERKKDTDSLTVKALFTALYALSVISFLVGLTILGNIWVWSQVF